MDRRVPGHGGSPVGVGNGEQSMGATIWASPGLGWRCGGRAMGMKQRQRRSSKAAALKLWERGKGEGVGAVRTGGGISLL
jgi:hypothetical protein